MVKRQSVWFPGNQESLVLAGAAFITNLANIFTVLSGLNSLRGYTLVRTIGTVSVRPLAPASTGLAEYGAGIMMNATSDPPTPAVIDPRASPVDWIWWLGASVGLEGAETSDTFFGAFTRYHPIDSRAMRKHASQGSTLFWSFKNDSAVSLTVHFSLRMLFKLP